MAPLAQWNKNFDLLIGYVAFHAERTDLRNHKQHPDYLTFL